MNHCEPPHLSVAARRALHCLSLLLLPALAPKGADALPRATHPRDRTGSPGAQTASYLPILGSPPLRMQEAIPPPDLVTRPPAAAPPQPALTAAENSVAADNAEAARSVSSPPAAAHENALAAAKPSPVPESAAAAVPAKPTPPAILPDDARPAVRPEDFLPFFQTPGSAKQPGDVTLLVPVAPSAPAPAPLPPSSATYLQTK